MVKLILDKSSKKHQETSMKHPGPFWSSQKMETNDVTKNDILVVFFNIPIPTNKIEVSCTWLLFPPAPSEPHVTTRPSARTAAKASRLQSTTTTGTMGTMGTMGTKHQKRKKKLGVSSFDAWSLVTLMVSLGSSCRILCNYRYAPSHEWRESMPLYHLVRLEVNRIWVSQAPALVVDWSFRTSCNCRWISGGIAPPACRACIVAPVHQIGIRDVW